MLRRIGMILAVSVLTLPLAACDFSATGNVKCETNAEGLYVCTGSSTATPKTPVPTTTPTVPPTSSAAPAPTTTPPAPSTSTAPPVTSRPSTTVPPAPTTDLPAPAALTAAERFGWGTPLPGSDEFNYTGQPDPNKWSTAGECWAGHAGNGKRCGSASVVDGTKLVQTGKTNGDSAWLGSKTGQQYGRWEARVRSEATTANNGRQYHPLLIIWPDSNRWPQDGEYDFFENNAPGQNFVESFTHYPHNSGAAVQQEHARKLAVDTKQWHNVAIEWTPAHVKGFIDGTEWFSFSNGANSVRKNIQDMPKGHLTIQLDNFFGANMQGAKYEVDWARIYKA